MINNSYIEYNLACLNNNHQKNIEFYCETCNDIPMCKECIPSHSCHSIKIYDIDKQEKLITDFSSSKEEYQNEVVFLNEELSRLQDQFNETQINSVNKIKLVEDEFIQLHQIIELEKLNLIRQIQTYQDENNQQFINKKLKIENKIQILNQSINRFFNKEIDNNLYKQKQLSLIQKSNEIKNFINQINRINIELPPFLEVIQPFNHFDFKINNNDNINNISKTIDDYQQTPFKFKDFINNTYSIENKKKLKVTNNNNYIVLEESILNKLINNYKCYILTPENTEQSNDNNILLCLDNNFIKNNYNNIEILNHFKIIVLHHQTKPYDNSMPLLDKLSFCYYQNRIPNYQEIQIQYFNHSSYGRLIIQPGFKNAQLIKGVLPEGVKSLNLYNFEQTFKIGSIPSSVKYLVIQNGFKHKLIKDMIPKGVEELELYNIEQPLEIGSIPSSVKVLRIHDGFKHQLIKGIIPKGVETLVLYNIEKELKNGSIPSSVKDLAIQDGFKHQLKDIIPESVEHLKINNIEKPLETGSIPFSVNFLHISDGYKHQLTKDIIPIGVYSLQLSNIEQPLEIGSIPSSVKVLRIHDGFKHQLTKGIIPKGVEALEIYNIEKSLEIGSIPSSVKCLHIQDGFKHQLTKGIIPEGVEALEIYNIEKSLEIGSIPSSVKCLHIQDGFKHQLTKGIIPEGVETLELYNIEKSLEIGSIPSSVKFLHIQNGFKLQLTKGIIPEGVISVYINSHIKLKDVYIPTSVQNIYIYNDDVFINSNIINDNFKNIQQIYLTEKKYSAIAINNINNKKLKISKITNNNK